MSDPFASLDPIGKPKTPAEQVLSTPQFNHHGAPVTPAALLGMYGAPGMGQPPNMMGMGMQGMMNPMGMGQQGMMNPMGMNLTGMGQPGMNMGGMQPNPFQQQQQQPVMYDNIKNLLQQKPKQPESFVDSASMDFLENLGGGKTSSFGATTNSFGTTASPVRAAEPVHSVSDPFGGGSVASPVLDSASFGIFENGSSQKTSTTTSSGGGTKSSALADRLTNGRRKTQEAQRSQLNFSAQSFANTTGVAKISLREDISAGGSAYKSQDAVDLDFGSSSATNVVFNSDDIFDGGASTSQGSDSRNGSGQFPKTQRTNSGSNAANTFW